MPKIFKKKTLPMENNPKGLKTVEEEKKQPIKITKKNFSEHQALFRCSCGGFHFRHAGYVEAVMPFMRSDGERLISDDSNSVKVCVKCRKCYVFVTNKWYDITELIDLKAWEKAEEELHKATGPGGQC